MTQFLIEHFVKDYEDVEKISVRTAYGVLASIVGIFCNVFLFAVKFTIGVIAHRSENGGETCGQRSSVRTWKD